MSKASCLVDTIAHYKCHLTYTKTRNLMRKDCLLTFLHWIWSPLHVKITHISLNPILLWNWIHCWTMPLSHHDTMINKRGKRQNLMLNMTMSIIKQKTSGWERKGKNTHLLEDWIQEVMEMIQMHVNNSIFLQIKAILLAPNRWKKKCLCH